ncbi:MAG TPA: hypothetical protein VFV52_12705 [Bacilli bacterium]|nr:hypothetical protein [Bacilli bacterium]
MNPGVQATIITIVWIILVMTGWGRHTLTDARLKPRAVSILLVLFLLMAGHTYNLTPRLALDIGGLLLPLGAWVWSLLAHRNASYQVQWLLGMITVAASMVILMTLVPMDPAFFLIDVDYLYPLTVIIISVMSVRRPYFALSIALVGMAMAFALDPFLHGRSGTEDVVLGSGDVRDTLLYTASGVLLLHGPYHRSASYIKSRVRALFGDNSQQQEGGPEHV